MPKSELSQQSEWIQRFYRAVGWRLAVARQLEGMTIGQAARKAGVDPRSWRRWEAGARVPWPPFLKICEAFEISPSWLLSGKCDADTPDGPDGGGGLRVDIAA
jgi:transcriptional regulator with XRE-family HTH domain